MLMIEMWIEEEVEMNLIVNNGPNEDDSSETKDEFYNQLKDRPWTK